MNEHLMQRARDLHQAGRFTEAAQLYQQMLLTDPMQFEPVYSLGMICAQTGQLEDAQKLLANAMAINPRFPEGWCTRGVMLLRLQRHGEALSCFERALVLKPDFPEALSNCATALLELRRLPEAIEGFDRVLVLRPDHAISWNNRGNALAALKRFEEAVQSYDKALAAEPNLSQAEVNRQNALFELGRATRCPPGYMRGLFDEFATHYDQTMLEKLNYRAHLHLRSLANRVLPQAHSPRRILDLGCGTGLVGEAFKDLAAGGRLDGIDIAPRMIEAARTRGIYDELILGDLEAVLAEPGGVYELILAADTMIYIGDLSACFAGVTKRLAPDGFYLFAVESWSGEGWQQTPMNRFRHSAAYLRNLATAWRMRVVELMECTLRRENSEPVKGFAVALQK